MPDKGKVRAKAYDLVLNGVELSSGSIRITDPSLQARMFAALGLSDEEAARKFGFLTGAFQYGAPPHGGFGIGLDRLVMLMAGADSIREVIAFPKVQNASELMSECPSPVDEAQLKELGIQTIAGRIKIPLFSQKSPLAAPEGFFSHPIFWPRHPRRWKTGRSEYMTESDKAPRCFPC